MPLIQSSSKDALSQNIGEMLASSKVKGTQMNKNAKKFGKSKMRQMALAAAFAIKDKAKRR
jgi:hypothetical protein